jgi:monofunctional biosynthetic peptidoglycan transglycosylase
LLVWSFGLLLILCIVSAGEVLWIRFYNPPFTLWMGWQWLSSRALSDRPEGPYVMPRIYWRSLKQISPYLIRAVLAGEDQRFLSHRGFDLVEMQDAFEEMLASGRMRGASTITMQAARTVFLWPSRNWPRKVLEAYYTVLLELLWDKKRILEVYLNTVDWGDGIAGAEAAAKHYFRKTSSGITSSEAALLAAVLPNPHAWSPVRPSDSVKERQRRILRDMEKMPVTRLLR